MKGELLTRWSVLTTGGHPSNSYSQYDIRIDNGEIDWTSLGVDCSYRIISHRKSSRNDKSASRIACLRIRTATSDLLHLSFARSNHRMFDEKRFQIHNLSPSQNLITQCSVGYPQEISFDEKRR